MTQNTGNDSQWKGRKDRDDTPSFIRNVETKSTLLTPGRRDSLPVLAVPKSVKIWQKVRWPLAVGTVIIILAIVGVFTNNILVNKNVKQRLEDAMIGETFAHVQVMYESNRVLKSLSDKYGDHPNVQAAFAWNSVLLARLFNEEKKLLPQAQTAFASIEDDASALAIAAKIGHLVLQKKYSDAETLLNDGLKRYSNEPRLHLIQAWLYIARGKSSEGEKKLIDVRKQFPEYLPPLYTLIEVAISQGDSLAIATFSSELLQTSTGNLYGALTSLLIRLPGWNKEPLSSKELKELKGVALELKKKVSDAPDVLKAYSRFLDGRMAMQQNDNKRAIEILKPLLNDQYNLNVLAWYGKAVMEDSGPRAALKALQSASDTPRIEIYDLRARAYLALYDVDKAEKALDTLRSNSSFNLSELQWILAVRKGDLKKAKAKLPKMVSRRLQPVVLEMYDLLRKWGDRDGLKELTAAMREGNLSECADVIDGWHENRLQKILYWFSTSDDACVTTLALSLMKYNYSPQTLVTLAKKIPVSAYNPRTQVDRIYITWKTEGYAPALSQLDSLASETINSGPLLVAITELYFDMGEYNKAYDLISKSDYPEAIALQIQLLQKLNKKKKALILLNKSMSKPETNTNPAIVALDIAMKYEAGKIGEVIEIAEAAIPNAGAWSSEIAAYNAMAMSAMGERGDADRYLTAFIKPAGRVAGLSESWEVQKSIIRINLRRGGNFLFKAVAYTVDMYKSKVDDTEVVYSYGVESQRQGNSRGAVRYFNDAIELDPAYVPAYKELLQMGELTDEHRETLKKYRPNVHL
ncbi:MAG: hypothetical protein JXR76_01395 [Deltaproteobacteria bacterium]|nr:hypothetical protein [Deltaproteobacteria bacterium]